VVNHDPRKGKEIVRNLEALSGGKPQKQRFKEHFQFGLALTKLSGDAAYNADEISAEAARIAALHVRRSYPRLVLVDLCMAHRTDDFEPGVGLAVALKKEFRQVPVWIYTTMEWNRNAIFAASSGPADGLISLNNFLEQADNLWNLLGSCNSLQRDALGASLSSVFAIPDWFRVEWDEKGPSDSSFSLRRAAEVMGFLFFGQSSEIDRLVLSEMQPGFSGTYLIKAMPYDQSGQQLPNIWVMKIAEHAREIAKLKEEMQGYAAVIHRMDKTYRPELYQPEGTAIKRILSNWWGGFALSFEIGFKPLIEAFSEIDPASVYREVFSRCLSPLYGQPERLEAPLPTPSGDTLRSAARAMEEDKRFHDVLKEALPSFIDDFGVVKKRASEGPTTYVGREVGKAFHHVHGDLNCRNIMIRKKDGGGWDIKLVDFPYAAANHPMPAATDFAKAETELLFLIMDHESGREIDARAIPGWKDLYVKFVAEQDLTERNFSSLHYQHIYDCVRVIRDAYGAIVGRGIDDWWQYRHILLEYTLRCLGHRDITPVKRAGCIAYSRLILDSLA
jgi:hypothetical protein